MWSVELCDSYTFSIRKQPLHIKTDRIPCLLRQHIQSVIIFCSLTKLSYSTTQKFRSSLFKGLRGLGQRPNGVWGETPTFSADRQEDQLVERQIGNGIGIQLVNGF